MDALGNVTVPATSSTVIQLSGADVQQFIPARSVAYAVVLNTNGNGMSWPSGRRIRFTSASGQHLSMR